MSLFNNTTSRGNGLPFTYGDSVKDGRVASTRKICTSYLCVWKLLNSPLRHLTRALGILLSLIVVMVGSSAQAQEFNEFDLLLLDFTLGRDVVGQSVTAYRYRESIVVSLAEAGAALEFPIAVDYENGTASGWFIEKERTFELNVNEGTVTVNGETVWIDSNEVAAHDFSIFVSLDVFSKWFPVDLEFNESTMTIAITPREKLPAQLRADRKRHAGRRYVVGPPTLPEIPSPYKLIGSHSMDLSLGYFVRRETKPYITAPDNSLNYSALIRGDLAYMTSSIYLAGNDRDALTNGRITLSRARPDTPEGIGLIEVGDVTPINIRGAPQADLERGVVIKGGTFKDSNLYTLDGNRTHISGNELEGWEVELLQNGVRIDYQIVGADGRYDFRDLLLYGGANEFQLNFYGPAGEQRTETVIRYAGPQTIRKGNLNYEFSASQKDKSVYSDDASSFAEDPDAGTGRIGATVRYGVSKYLSLNGGWNNVVVSGKRLNYLTAGFGSNLHYINLSASVTRDPLGGNIFDGQLGIPATLKLWGIRTEFNHTRYATSVLDTDDESGTQISTRTQLSMSGNYGNIFGRFLATHSESVSLTSKVYNLDVSHKLGALRYGNSFIFKETEDLSRLDTPDQLTGVMYLTAKASPLAVRASAVYQLKPQSGMVSYNATATVSVDYDMDMTFGLDHFVETDVSLFSAGMNWHMNLLTLSPRLTYDSNGRYTGFVWARTSFAPRPDRFGVLMRGKSLASRGGVAARVFLDVDGDGKFGGNDKPLANVDVYADQSFRHEKTDKNGVAYIIGVDRTRPTDVRIDQASLPDISMYSTHTGNSVAPRPGGWHVIDFPVIGTGVVEGIIYQKQEEDKIFLPGAMVELRKTSGELESFVISGYDGYFVFEHVPYGKYVVTVKEESRKRLISGEKRVLVNENTPEHFGIELTMKRSVSRGFGFSQSLPASELENESIVKPEIKPVTSSIVPIEEKEILPPAVIVPSVTQAPAQTDVKTESNSSWALQLGAYSSRPSAENAIQQYKQRLKNQLQGGEYRIERADLGARGIFYRVYAYGNMNEAEARLRCNQLKRTNQSCMVVKLD